MFLVYITLLLLLSGLAAFFLLIVRVSPQWRSDDKIIEAIQSRFRESGWSISKTSYAVQIANSVLPSISVEIYREVRQPWSHESYSTATNRSFVKNPRVLRFRYWKPEKWVASYMVLIPSNSFKQQIPPCEYKVLVEFDSTTIVRFPSFIDLPEDQAYFLQAVIKSIRNMDMPLRLLPLIVEIGKADVSLIFGSFPRSQKEIEIIEQVNVVFYRDLTTP